MIVWLEIPSRFFRRGAVVKTGRIALGLLCIVALCAPVQMIAGMILALFIVATDLKVSEMLNPTVNAAMALVCACVTIPLGIHLWQKSWRPAGFAEVATPAAACNRVPWEVFRSLRARAAPTTGFRPHPAAMVQGSPTEGSPGGQIHFGTQPFGDILDRGRREETVAVPSGEPFALVQATNTGTLPTPLSHAIESPSTGTSTAAPCKRNYTFSRWTNCA